MAARICFFITLLLFLQGCSHPLEIEGEGDIINWGLPYIQSEVHGCTLEQFRDQDIACTKNYSVSVYYVNYHAAPRQGWVFKGWEGICGDKGTSTCKLEISNDVVTSFWFKTMPATKAVFETIPEASGDGVKLSSSSGIAYDEAKGLIYSIGFSEGDDFGSNPKGFVSIDIKTGNRRTISSSDQVLPNDTGDGFSSVFLDEVNNRLIIKKRFVNGEQLIAINISTGARTVLASPTLGTVGAGLDHDLLGVLVHVVSESQIAYFLAYEDILIHSESDSIGLVKIDLGTGDRSFLSKWDGSIGSGVSIGTFRGAVYDSKRDRFIVTDILNFDPKFIAVHPISGNREIFAKSSLPGIQASLIYDEYRDRIYGSANGQFLEYVDLDPFVTGFVIGHSDNASFDKDRSELRNYILSRGVIVDGGEAMLMHVRLEKSDANLPIENVVVKHHIDSGHFEIISR
jgi:hypothetical protein